MFEQDAYGHFGAPDTLSKNYGAGTAQTIQSLAQQAQEPQESEQSPWELFPSNTNTAPQSDTTALYVPQGRVIACCQGWCNKCNGATRYRY
jgi:hypothetical protein